MKIRCLTKEVKRNPKEQILINRGITDISYLENTESHIN